MTKEEIIDNIARLNSETWRDREEVRTEIGKLLAELRQALAQPTQRWIPCSERLPEEIGTYLVTLEYKEHGKGITTLWYHGKQFGWDLRVADVVVAWQPLPQPYEEKRGSKNG